jgi:hypothetical protein
MKPCPFCKANIATDAVRCRYCTSWIEQSGSEEKQSDNANVVYILDRGLVKFGKFAVAILAMFLVVGVYVWGLDLKDNENNLKETEKEVRMTRDDITRDRESIKRDRDEINGIRKELLQIQKESLEAANGAKATVSELEERARQTRGQFDWISLQIRQEIIKNFTGVLPSDQYFKLEAALRQRTVTPAQSGKNIYTEDEVLQLVQDDIRRAVAFYRK